MFWKTRKVKCTDGREITVHRNLDDAFPLHIPGLKASLKASGSFLNKASAGASSEYASAIQGLLFSIDELNSGLMMTFRGVYLLYSSDPCNNSEFFKREVERLNEEQRSLRTLRLQIDGLIQLAQLQPNDHQEITRMFIKIMDTYPSIRAPLATEDRIRHATQIAQEMVERKIHE